MGKSRRKRCLKFTHQEEELLLQLVKKHEDVIENKESAPTISQEEKAETWEKLMRKFNSQRPKRHRTAEELRHKYEILKDLARAKRSKQIEDIVLEGQNTKYGLNDTRGTDGSSSRPPEEDDELVSDSKDGESVGEDPLHLYIARNIELTEQSVIAMEQIARSLEVLVNPMEQIARSLEVVVNAIQQIARSVEMAGNAVVRSVEVAGNVIASAIQAAADAFRNP